MSSFRVLALARFGAIGALLLSGCSLLPSVSGAPSFHADALVGADTWSFTDVTLRPSVQQALYAQDVSDLFTSPASGVGANVSRLPTPSGRSVDFEHDLLPRLDGEVVVALSGPPTHPSYTLLTHTNDIDGTVRLLANEAQPVITRDSRGATRYDPHRGSAIVVGYKNWVVYTNSTAVLDQTLDRIDGKGGPSLATDARYRSAVDRLTGDRLGYGYLDVAPLIAQATRADMRLADGLRARGRIAYSFGFETGPEAGVRALGIRLDYMPDAPLGPASANASGEDALQAMDRLPRGSIFAMAGSQLGISEESFAALNDDERVPSEVQPLLRDLAGPYAFGVTPTSPEGAGDEPLGSLTGRLFLLAKLVPGADVEQLKTAGAAIADYIATVSVDSESWQQNVVVDEGWLSVNAFAAPAQLDQTPQDLLTSNRMYQWLRPGFVQNGTNVYVDVDAVKSAFERQLPSKETRASLSLIRAVGMSAHSDAQGDTEAHIQVLMASR